MLWEDGPFWAWTHEFCLYFTTHDDDQPPSVEIVKTEEAIHVLGGDNIDSAALVNDYWRKQPENLSFPKVG